MPCSSTAWKNRERRWFFVYRVIIADDEPDICAGMKTLIDWEALGFEVAGTAENGLQAMELEEELKADLVITDIRMPLMDGLELARRLKKQLRGYSGCYPQRLSRLCLCKTRHQLGQQLSAQAGGYGRACRRTQKDQADAGSAPYFHEEYTLPEEDGPGIRRFPKSALY